MTGCDHHRRMTLPSPKPPRWLLALLLGTCLLGAGACGEEQQAAEPPPPDPFAFPRAYLRVTISHHNAGIEMARQALARSDSRATRLFALSVIGSRKAEIREMTALLNGLPPAPGDSEPAAGTDPSVAEPPAPNDYATVGVSPDQLGFPPGGNGLTVGPLETAEPFDRAFLDLKAVNLRGAITLARTALLRAPEGSTSQRSSRRGERRTPKKPKLSARARAQLRATARAQALAQARIKRLAARIVASRICEVAVLSAQRERLSGFPLGGDPLSGSGTGLRSVRCTATGAPTTPLAVPAPQSGSG